MMLDINSFKENTPQGHSHKETKSFLVSFIKKKLLAYFFYFQNINWNICKFCNSKKSET
jgi:hypothetical protein